MFNFNRISGHVFKRLAIVTVLSVMPTATVVMYSQADNTSKQSTGSVTPIQSPVINSINVNNASAEELAAALKGVGLERAKAIVDWRNKNGQFEQIDDLLKVKGIGKKILSANAGKISL